MNILIGMMERGVLPDAVIRLGIRLLHRRRLRQEDHGGVEANREHQRRFFADLAAGPVAVATDAANRQHYELPPEFFGEVLGPRRKYSCCLYPSRVRDLATAEEVMLRQTCRRAGLADGMDILELGCGWGSLTLWMAEHYRNSRITAVSNSLPQRIHIEECCKRLKLDNVRVITADMNHFATDERFDRVVSVEMFEHMQNYP